MIDKMTGDDELLVDIDLDLPTNVAAASGWVAPDVEDKEKPDADAATKADPVTPQTSKELEDARRAAQEAQARLDALQKQAETDRAERLRAQEEAQKNQTYALNAHLARKDAELAQRLADEEQLNTGINAWRSHVDMAKRQLAAAREAGDAKAEAEMMDQIAQGHAMMAQLEAGKLGVKGAIEQAKRDREMAVAAARRAAEQAQEEAERRAKEPETKAATPDDFINSVRSTISDSAAEWFKQHKEFVTDGKLHQKMKNFVEDWVDRNGESAVRGPKFIEALDERFGFAQPKKAASAPAPAANEEDDVEDETPTRAPAAPVSRGNSVGKAPGTTGSKVRLSADEAQVAAAMYPELSPAEARKKYATNKARLIADNRL